MSNPNLFGFFRTYGLLFVAILICISVFVIFGFINPLHYKTDSCTTMRGLDCLDGSIRHIGSEISIEIMLQNVLRDDILVNESSLTIASILFQDSSLCYFKDLEDSIVLSGAIFSISCIIPENIIPDYKQTKSSIVANFEYVPRGSGSSQQGSVSLFSKIE
jgi:hypothetical protein